MQNQNRQLSPEVVRFVLVGIFNTILDFVLMNIFRIFFPLILANTLSTGIAMLCSFFLNKKWTFRNAGKDYVRQVTLFFIFTIIGIWVIQNGVIWLIENLIPRLGMPDIIFVNLAKILATPASLIWNYLTYKNFVFTSKSSVENN